MVTWILILIVQDPSTGHTSKQSIPGPRTQEACLQWGKDTEASIRHADPALKTYSQCVPAIS